MSKLGVVEDTLFVPMLGRIYASEYCPQILYDPKALELKEKLPSDRAEVRVPRASTHCWPPLFGRPIWTGFIRVFLERRPDGIIVQLGCGLETTYHRCDNGHTRWYAVDLPHVVEYRRGAAAGAGAGNIPCRGCPLTRTGSGGSAPMCEMLPSWLLLVGCSTILRNLRLWVCSKCCSNSEI